MSEGSEADAGHAPDPEGLEEVVEEVVEEAEVPAAVVTPQGSPGGDATSPQSGSWDQSLHALSHSLELPVESLQSLGGSEEGKLLLQRVAQHHSAKENELEEYENTVKDLTQALSTQQQEGTHGVQYIEFPCMLFVIDISS